MQVPNTKLIWKVLLVASLLTPLFLLSTRMHPWTGSHNLATIVQELVYPFEYVWHSLSQGTVSTWRHYVGLKNAAIENTKLRSQMEQLQVKVIDYEEQALETARLRELLNFSQRFEKSMVVAEVLNGPGHLTFESMRIARGTRAGVKIGMPVVTANGVVGKVIRSGLNFSDVQLLTDSNFNLDVLLQRTRIRGVLRGHMDGRCVLQLERGAEIRIGDTIITSGIIGSFPKGLPVGQVVKITYASENVAQTITVEPWVDHRRVDEVIVLLHEDQELQKILETAGSDWLKDPLRQNTGG